MNSSDERKQHRLKCRVIAFVDLMWRFIEFSYLILEIIAYGGLHEYTNTNEPFGTGIVHGSILHKLMKIHRFGPHGFTMVGPLLGFLYIIATILQMALAAIMFKACTGSTLPENEMGACSVYCKVTLFSLFIMTLHFVFPFILVSLDHLLYSGARLLFIILGIIIVKLHIRNLQRSIEYDDTMVNIPL